MSNAIPDPQGMQREFLLQRIQPLMVGLIDGSLSTLAPIFSVALVSHHTFYAFVAGLATSIGAGISMAFSEGLSDTGELTGRGSPFVRGGITGVGTFIGGILHSLPFLIGNYHVAIVTALAVVAFELVALAVLRARFFSTSFATSLAAVSLAGAVIVAVSVLLGVTA
jgi:VIT1/CCC1 family predicted Fe2+/Mn2+ transporter